MYNIRSLIRSSMIITGATAKTQNNRRLLLLYLVNEPGSSSVLSDRASCGIRACNAVAPTGFQRRLRGYLWPAEQFLVRYNRGHVVVKSEPNSDRCTSAAAFLRCGDVLLRVLSLPLLV